jgi:hypothetical protein
MQSIISITPDTVQFYHLGETHKLPLKEEPNDTEYLPFYTFALECLKEASLYEFREGAWIRAAKGQWCISEHSNGRNVFVSIRVGNVSISDFYKIKLSQGAVLICTIEGRLYKIRTTHRQIAQYIYTCMFK